VPFAALAEGLSWVPAFPALHEIRFGLGQCIGRDELISLGQLQLLLSRPQLPVLFPGLLQGELGLVHLFVQ
jgi:hypothetical protein